jgi:hypothetical protein
MSKGLGRIQRECLRVIEEYEAAGRRPTTFNITAEVYQVTRDRHGRRTVSEAQHVATKRALANLRRRRFVFGQQDVTVHPDGTKHLSYCQRLADGSYTHRAERCCIWSRAQQINEPAGMPDSLRAIVYVGYAYRKVTEGL